MALSSQSLRSAAEKYCTQAAHNHRLSLSSVLTPDKAAPLSNHSGGRLLLPETLALWKVNRSVQSFFMVGGRGNLETGAGSRDALRVIGKTARRVDFADSIELAPSQHGFRAFSVRIPENLPRAEVPWLWG